jgi:DNA-binding response OmpR family regulator
VAVTQTPEGVEFSVTDTGSGIDPLDQEKIFEKFRQVGDTLTSKPKGTGLGLPISKQIVTAHKGRIGVSSELGKGARFFFVLPTSESGADLWTSPVMDFGASHAPLPLPGADRFAAERVTDRGASTPSVPPGTPADLVARIERHVSQTVTVRNGGSILVVDDDPNLRELVRQQLTERGYEVRQAVDGYEAIQMARQNKPDMILLDVMMPGISGFDVAAVLKSDPSTAGIPIIVLSIIQEAARGYSVGVDRYLNKPTEGDVLVDEIRQLLKRGRSPKKILVVNDQIPTSTDVIRLLEAKGYDVVGTSSADEFLEEVRRVAPDLVVLDADHPSMHKIVQAIRLEKDLQHVYVVQFARRDTSGGNS